MSFANLFAQGFPGCTSATSCSGTFNVEECTDPGGSSANLPTSLDNCEASTDNVLANLSSTGALTLSGTKAFKMWDLPNAALGPPTMAGSCDVAPNQCVLGIFASNPQSANGFSYPHLFSAAFNVDAGDGTNTGDNPGDGSAPAVAATSPSLSTVAANLATVAADGVDQAMITVSLKDITGNPVTSGKSVTLSQGSGSSVIKVNGSLSSTATTNAGGQAVFTVTDSTHENVTYTATDTTDNVTMTQTPEVTFAAPVVTAANSSVSALSTSVSDGGSTTVTVTLKDQGGIPQPIAGVSVALNQGAGSSQIVPGSATTDAEGDATFTVSDTKAETVTYTATYGAGNSSLTGQSVSVTFGMLTVSASDSTVTTSTPIVSSVAQNGLQPKGTVTVTLLDNTSPVAGKTVTLNASSSSAVISPSSVVTGADGQASFSVSDTTAETVTFNAVDTSDANLAIAASTHVTFEVPEASASTSSMTVVPSTVPADGTTGATITVLLEDQFHNPLAGKTVTVAGTVTGTGTASQTVKVIPSVQTGGTLDTTTNGSGSISFSTYDTTAERVTYTATDTTDNVTVTQTVGVTFTPGVPQVSQSTVGASPTSVPADGSTASKITVTLEDHNANPVPGVTVTLSALSGSSVISPVTGVTTNASGQATFEVTDATAETVRYRATDTTDNLPLVGEEVEVTFGTPPPTAPSIADSDIVASSATVPADGHSSASIEVILNDNNGLPLTGKEVTIVPSSVSAIVSPSDVTTDANGIATFTVTDRTAESVTFTATDITDNAPLSGLSATISFSPASSVATSASAGALNKPIVGMAATPDGKGYWLVASDGGIFSYGDATFYGSTGALTLNKPIVGMASTPDGKGYWLVASDGGIFSYGDATFYGSTGALTLNKPIVGMASTPDGKGYWLVASDGGIFSYGDATFYGSTGALTLNKPIVGMAATPDGKGYWLVASDGGIFSYGDATFYGSTGALTLNKPIVGMASTPDGKGYWLVASDGGIFSYGDATFYGSTGALTLNKPIVGMASTPDGKGYWLVASDGGIFT